MKKSIDIELKKIDIEINEKLGEIKLRVKRKGYLWMWGIEMEVERSKCNVEK